MIAPAELPASSDGEHEQADDADEGHEAQGGDEGGLDVAGDGIDAGHGEFSSVSVDGLFFVPARLADAQGTPALQSVTALAVPTPLRPVLKPWLFCPDRAASDKLDAVVL